MPMGYDVWDMLYPVWWAGILLTGVAIVFIGWCLFANAIGRVLERLGKWESRVFDGVLDMVMGKHTEEGDGNGDSHVPGSTDSSI
ncbi:MAG: hypothetical protein PHQ43_01060 [Dehalococcoidales bacterium]|nr:hypothetical protein [Dehalococcoidales bacterium]